MIFDKSNIFRTPRICGLNLSKSYGDKFFFNFISKFCEDTPFADLPDLGGILFHQKVA
jgi:hypothetical protein